MDSKQLDAQNILKLYELRRDELMRRARAWYFTAFNPQSAQEIVNLMLSGQQESASYRMVTSYWDMAAALVNHGGIDEQMFSDANGEHLLVFAVLEPFIAEVRASFGEPAYLANLEALVRRKPNATQLLESRRRLKSAWMKQAKS